MVSIRAMVVTARSPSRAVLARADRWSGAASLLVLHGTFELRAGEVAALVIVADRIGAAPGFALARLLQHGLGIAGRLVAVAISRGIVPPAARVGGDAVE